LTYVLKHIVLYFISPHPDFYLLLDTVRCYLAQIEIVSLKHPILEPIRILPKSGLQGAHLYQVDLHRTGVSSREIGYFISKRLIAHYPVT